MNMHYQFPPQVDVGDIGKTPVINMTVNYTDTTSGATYEDRLVLDKISGQWKLVKRTITY